MTCRSAGSIQAVYGAAPWGARVIQERNPAWCTLAHARPPDARHRSRVVRIGPLAIRWYALAYVAGLLLGWLLMRMLVTPTDCGSQRQRRPTVVELDDLLSMPPRRRGRRACSATFFSTACPIYRAEPGEILQVWHGGMAFHGGLLGVILAILIFAWRKGISALTLFDLMAVVAPDRAFLRPARQFHQPGAMGPCHRRAVGRGVPHRRAAAAPSQPALRGGPGGCAALVVLVRLCPPHRLSPTGAAAGVFGIGYALARSFSELFREPDPDSEKLATASPWAWSCRCPCCSRASRWSSPRSAAAAPTAGAGRVTTPDEPTPLGRVAPPGEVTPLLDELRLLIEAEGPISVDRYMQLCLGHPRHGYYMTRDPFGAASDFVTAPEISQMFGELIGLWCVETWQRLGSPRPFHLVELGPGRGTLMADALRAARLVPPFGPPRGCIWWKPARSCAAARGRRWPPRARRCVARRPRGPAYRRADAGRRQRVFDALPVRQFEGGRWLA